MPCSLCVFLVVVLVALTHCCDAFILSKASRASSLRCSHALRLSNNDNDVFSPDEDEDEELISFAQQTEFFNKVGALGMGVVSDKSAGTGVGLGPGGAMEKRQRQQRGGASFEKQKAQKMAQLEELRRLSSQIDTVTSASTSVNANANTRDSSDISSSLTGQFGSKNIITATSAVSTKETKESDAERQAALRTLSSMGVGVTSQDLDLSTHAKESLSLASKLSMSMSSASASAEAPVTSEEQARQRLLASLDDTGDWGEELLGGANLSSCPSCGNPATADELSDYDGKCSFCRQKELQIPTSSTTGGVKSWPTSSTTGGVKSWVPSTNYNNNKNNNNNNNNNNIVPSAASRAPRWDNNNSNNNRSGPAPNMYGSMSGRLTSRSPIQGNQGIQDSASKVAVKSSSPGPKSVPMSPHTSPAPAAAPAAPAAAPGSLMASGLSSGSSGSSGSVSASGGPYSGASGADLQSLLRRIERLEFENVQLNCEVEVMRDMNHRLENVISLVDELEYKIQFSGDLRED